MTITLSALQKQRWDTAANWTAENPTLLAGEIGIESDTGYWKVGNGSTAWTSLAYVSGLGAEISVDRLADGTAGQIIQTDSAGTGVEWSSTANLPLGSASAPAYRFQGDANTGIYSPGADQLALSTNGTGRLFVDASGEVGIGTASPNYLLHNEGGTIYSNLRADNATSTPLRLSNSSTTGTAVVKLAFSNAATVKASINAAVYGNDYLAFNTGSDTERLRITSTGQLSHIGGGSAVSPAVGFNGSAPSNSLVLDSTGRLGIGTSSPSTLLHLSSATGSALPTPTELRIATTTNASDWSTTDPWGRLSFYSADTSGAGPKIHASIDAISQDQFKGVSSLNFRTSLSDGTLPVRMTINNTGNVGIGSTSPDAKLEVVESSTGEIEVARFRIEGQTNNPMLRILADEANKLLTIGTSGSTAGSELRFNTKASSTESARIDSSGRLLVGTSSALSAGGNSQYGLIQVEGNSASGNGQGILTLARGTAPGSITTGQTLGMVVFSANNGGEYGEIRCEADGAGAVGDYPGRLTFSSTPSGSASPVERMRITSDAYVRLASGTGGIQFNGDTAAANALDDYEEGTCFASTGNWSSSAQTRYTKVGRYVFINFRGSVTTSPQTLSLPFASSYADSLFGWSDISGTATKLILSSATQITLDVGYHKGFLQYQAV